MKNLIVLIFISSFVFASNIEIKYFAREHNNSRYKLVKELRFHKEIMKKDLKNYSSYVKVLYKDGKIRKYESINQQGKKIYETILDDKEQIKKISSENGAETTYFYEENLVISKYILNDKPIVSKAFYVNNRIVSLLDYDKNSKLIKMTIFDFTNWKKINYDGNGNFINKTFLPKPNK